MIAERLSSDVKFDNDNFTFYGDDGVSLAADLRRSIELQSPRADVLRRLRGATTTSQRRQLTRI